MRIVYRFASLCFLILLTAQWAPALDDPPKPPHVLDPPIPIFLQSPYDLDAFWKQLARPDIVILDGEHYRKLKQASEKLVSPKYEAEAVAEALAVTGEVEDNRARLLVEIRVAMAGEGPSWFPIHLDGMTLIDVRDGSGALATRTVEGQRWEVELSGRGGHVLQIGLLAPVRPGVGGRKLTLAVPPCAETRIDLIVNGPVNDASTGPGELLEISHLPGRPAVRLISRLKPRSQFELAWTERSEPDSNLPTLLSAQGEISLEIDRGSIRSKSSWIVGSIRGTVTELTMQLDPAEVLLDVEVDGRAVLEKSRRDLARSTLSIPLADPLRSGSTRSLLLNTKRPIDSLGQARVSIQGYALDHAKVQSGVIAVAKTGPLFIDSSAGRNLRRIDPRTELPESLRSRQDTSLAFGFNDQPFALNLIAESDPPRVNVESRSTITVGPRSAEMQSWLDYRISPGRIFELRVIIPAGLKFDGVEPAEVVESSRVVPISLPDATPLNAVGLDHLLTISLTPKARESDHFSILLKGSTAVDPSKLVEIPAFRPAVDTDEGGRAVIVSDRHVLVDLADREDVSTKSGLEMGTAPAEWSWPGRRPGLDMGLLWLRFAADLANIPLRVSVRPRSFHHESTTSASIDRSGIEVVEEIAGEVAFGVVSRLDLSLPPGVPSSWEVEGQEVTGRETLGLEDVGSRRVRLKFNRDLVDSFRIRIRYRIPFAKRPTVDRAARVVLAPIQVMEGTSTGRRAVISTAPGLETLAKGQDWSASPPQVDSASGISEASSGACLALEGASQRPGPIELFVRSGPPSPLPGVLVSRLWVETIQRSEWDWVASAKLRVESRDGTVTIALPQGARLIRLSAGGAQLGENRVASGGQNQYRIRFADAGPSGPTLVIVDYEVPASAGTATLEVVDGGVVQETMWEAQVPGNRAGLGTPSGWMDENEWYWAGLTWRRRPRKSSLELGNWLAVNNSTATPGNAQESVERVGRQSYLFSRDGPPNATRFPTYSRLTLLLFFSGPVLVVGLLVLAGRISHRLVSITAVFVGILSASVVEWDVLLVAGQSSLLGVALWLSALGIHWAIERNGLAHSPAGGVLVSTTSAGSAPFHQPAIGSDDSTAIRPRPSSLAPSTADHVVLTRPGEVISGDVLISDSGLK